MNDDNHRQEQLSRRTVVSTTATGLAIAIAGCSQVDGLTSDDPTRAQPTADDDQTDSEETDDGDAAEQYEGAADFTEITVDAPDAITVDESFSLTVSVTNEGGETGTFTDTLEVGHPDASTDESNIEYEMPVEIEDVEPGGTASIDLPVDGFEYADEYAVGLVDEETVTSVSVDPITNGIGSTHTLDGGLRFTLTDITYEGGVFYQYEERIGTLQSVHRTGLQAPLADQIYVVYHFTIENTGTSATDIDIDSFDARNGDRLETVGGNALTAVDEFEGNPLHTVTLGAGERTNAWTIVQFDRETIDDGFEFGYQRDNPGTIPETVWVDDSSTVGQSELPAFEFVEIDAPVEAEVMAEPTYTVTVENVGGSAGKFRGVVQRRERGSNDWIDWKVVESEVERGEKTMMSVDDPRETMGTVEYRIQPFGEEQDVRFITAQRGHDEPFTTPGGLEIKPVEYVESDSFETDGTATIGESEESANASRFVTVGIEYHRPNQAADSSVSSRDFSIVADGERVSRENVGNLAEYVHPVEGETLSGMGVKIGERRVGYLSFEVQSDVALSELRLRWEDDDTAVEWEG